MDAPTEWTYGGQLDWSSPESLKLAPVGMCLRCIVEALKERASVVNYTLPSILSVSWNPFQTSYNIISAIQSSVTALIQLYCNHTDCDGDWSGLSDANDVGITWTESDILTYIEAESRLSLNILNPYISAYFFQQYQILNLLKWVKNSTRLSSPGIYYRKLGDGTSSEAIAEYNSSDWVLNGIIAYSWGASRSVGYIYNEEEDYLGETILRVRREYRHIQTGSILNSYDFYLYATAFGFIGTEATFNNQGDNVLENCFSKAETTSEFSETIDFYILDEDSIPPNRPPWIYPVEPYNKTWGWAATGAISIAKFDGANGFKFRDW